MNKLQIFDYINEVTAQLEDKRDSYVKAAGKITAYLENAFFNSDEIVGVTYRIKTASSLKEKIIRNELYKKYGSAELLSGCSDIIGIRIECRFLQDEAAVFDKLKELFPCLKEDGNYSPADKKNLFLKLDCPQPEKQKNGHEIYRIDGSVILSGERYNYELQIKSLVNSFWSEIEHKIIYKNKRFMMIDDFVSELMNSINDNLVNIDRQLNMLFTRCLDNSTEGQAAAMQRMLVTLINELYSRLVEEKAGISVNIKPYSESLVHYILSYSTFRRRGATAFDETPVSHRMRAEGAATEDEAMAATVTNLIDWMRTVDFDAINIGEEIVFAHPFEFVSALQRAIGEKLLFNMNKDFYCNTFFHILFSIEVGNNAQDFMSYVRFYEHRISAGKSEESIIKLIDEIGKADAGTLVLESEIARLEELK